MKLLHTPSIPAPFARASRIAPLLAGLGLSVATACSSPPPAANDATPRTTPDPWTLRKIVPAPGPDCSGVQQAWRNAHPRLAEAARHDRRALETAVADVRGEILGHRRHARRFAEEMLSLGTTWDYAVSSRREFEQLVARKFASIVLDPDALPARLAPTLAVFSASLDATDNQLLRDLRVDVEGLEVAPLPRNLGLRTTGAISGDVPGDVTNRVRHGFQVQVGALIGSEIAMSIGARIATRMGVRVATGAAGAAFTLGASLLLSVGVDAIVSEVDGTEDKLVREVETIVGEVADTVERGRVGRPGLRATLGATIRERQAARAQAIRASLHAPNDPEGICDL